MSQSHRAIAKKLAAQEEADRNRNKLSRILKIIIPSLIILVFTLGIALVANNIIKDREIKQQAQEEMMNSKGEQLTPETAAGTGSFMIRNEPNDDAVRVEYFFDPQCPACGVVEGHIGESLDRLVESGEIELHVYPVSFLDESSTDNYSSRAANAIVTVLEKSPEHALAFISRIFEENFQPNQGQAYMSVTDEDLIDAAVEVGVPEDIAETFKQKHYIDWTLENTEKQINRKDFFKNDFSTPSIFLNANYDHNSVDDDVWTAKDFTKVAFDRKNYSASFNDQIRTARLEK